VRSLARLRATGGAKPFPSKDFTPAKRASTLSRHASTTLLRLVVGQRPNAESGLIVIHGREPGISPVVITLSRTIPPVPDPLKAASRSDRK